MRVFETLYFDLKKQVLFKDTLTLVESWFKEQGIYYENMAFMLDVSYGDRFNKAVKVFPELERYRRKHCIGYELTDEGLRTVDGQILPFQYEISSVPQNWPESTDIHVRKEDEQLVRKVVPKIPRPINPGFTLIVLDNVHWFHKINTAPGIDDNGGKSYPNAISLHPHYSNNLTLMKAFDYGIKHNIVCTTIERTKSHEELLNTSPIVDKLTALLGVPIRTDSLKIIFNDAEIRANKAAKKAIAPVLQSVWDELQPEQSLLAVTKNNLPIYEITKKIYDGREIDQMTKNETGNISIKKSVVKYLKPLGFAYRYVPSFCFESVKKNRNNHVVEIGFAMKPMTWTLNYWITFRGYNFSINVPLGVNMDAANQQIVDSIVKKVAEIAVLAEERLTEPLFEYYGKSPEWY